MTTRAEQLADKEIGDRVKAIRNWRGLTQANLVEKMELGWHFSTLAKIETGERALRVREMPKLATALGLTVSEFFSCDAPNLAREARLEELRLKMSALEDEYQRLQDQGH